MPDGLYIGIDVAKAQLDLATVPPSAVLPTVAHDAAGITALIAQLQSQPVALIVVEATGGWERDLVSALALVGLPIAVVNPRQVRDFAKALGRKRIRSMRGCSPSLRPGCARRRARCRTRRTGNSRPSSPAGSNCWTCLRPNVIGC